ncbi:MAG: PAS domain-containing protein [Bacteroidales bacterium]|nr:PAS domain-containing protein [Bacteroidales bacterium]
MDIVSTSNNNNLKAENIRLKNLIGLLEEELVLYKTFVSYSDDFESLVSPEGEYLITSPSCKSITGYDPERFIENRDFLEEISLKEDRWKINHNFTELKSSDKLETFFESRILTKEKNLLTLEHHIRKIIDTNGVLKGFKIKSRDISFQKRLEQELQLSNELIQEGNNLFTQGNVLLIKWKYETAGPVEYVSDNVSEVLGYTKEEITSETFRFADIIHPDDRDNVIKEIVKNATTGNYKFQHKPYRLLLKKGNIKWVSDYTILEKNEQGQVIRMYGYLIDITSMVKTQQHLQAKNEEYIKLNKEYKAQNLAIQKAKSKVEESENMLSIFLENSSSWETLNNTDGEVIFATPAFEKITGYNYTSYLKGQISIFDFCHPEDITLVRELFKGAIEGRNYTNVVHRIITKHKSIKYINISINQVILKNGQRFGFRTSIIDVSQEVESRQREKLFQKAVEQSPSSIIIANKKGIIEYTNQKYKEVSEDIESTSFTSAKGMLSIINNGKRNKRHLFRTLLKNKTWSSELTNKRINGEINYSQVTISAIQDEIGNIQHYVVVMEDITQKKLEERLMLQAIVEAEEKERTRIAQELHDGVGPLISSAKMFVQCFTKPNQKMDNKTIAVNAEELLNEAQKNIRHISYSLSPHILQNFGLIDAIKSFAQKIESTGSVKINVSVNNYKPINSYTETVLYRALCECINNTIKHANASLIEIFFNFDADNLQIKYIDDGSGFDFNTTLSKKSGLGLFNLKSRLEIINGSVTIDSNPGKGTMITFVLQKI